MNLYQDVFFRSMDFLRGRKTIQRLKFLRRSQYWNKEEMAEWQLEKLQSLYKQAKENADFYKESLASFPESISSISDIQALPILTKDNIRNNQVSLKCKNVPEDRFVQSRTGGSTGKPMFYYWDKRGMDWNRASVYRSAEWANTQLGEKTVQMSGSHFDYDQAQSLKNKVMLFLQRYKDLSVAFLTEEILEDYLQQIIAYKPTSIWGYASGLSIFAEYILTKNPNVDLSFIKGIMTSSEVLLPEQRELINKAFGAKVVFNQYGSREMYMAAECSAQDGYHVHSEVLFIEIVNDQNEWCKPGETGRVLITDLSNHAFPFIRYEIGDLAIMDEQQQCSCGLWHQKIKSVEGRMGDVITLRDRKLTAPNFATLFSDKKGVSEYQIRQKKVDELKVLLVPDEHYSDAFEDYIRTSIVSMVPNDTDVELICVDEIEVPDSGKRRTVVSELK